MMAAGGTPRPGGRVPRPAPVRDEVRAALPAILEAHVGTGEVVGAFPLPAGRREKVIVRARGLAEPLILRVYGSDEVAPLENGLAAIRVIEARGEAPVAHCWGFDAAAVRAPFRYRLQDFLSGTDGSGLLDSGALERRDVETMGIALGEALSALHELAAEGFGEPRADPRARRGRLSDLVRDEIEQRGGEAHLLHLLDAAAPALDGRTPRGRLTHGGFGPRATILRKEGGRYELAGIVALDRARLFDPAYDLVALEDGAFAREPALRDPFREVYAARMGGIPEIEPARAALHRALRARSIVFGT